MAKKKWTKAERAAFARRMKRFRKKGGKKKTAKRRKKSAPKKGKRKASKRAVKVKSDPRLGLALRSLTSEIKVLNGALRRGFSGRAGRRLLK